MKKLIITVSVILAATFAANAQSLDLSRLSKRMEITTIEDDDIIKYEIFSMEDEGQKHYFISLGNVFYGDEIIQIAEPVRELFVPIGDSVPQAQATLQEWQTLFKEKPRSKTFTVDGCVSLGVPGSKFEPVTISYYKSLFTRYLEFRIHRDGYIGTASISKSDLSSLVTSLKIEHRLRPND